MSKSKKDTKKPEAKESAPKPSVAKREAGPAAKPILRAIRVTPELLTAAKAYKKATSTSFYALGLEAISARLEREGYLKFSGSGKGS
jgi:hypothetical protein